MVLVTVLTIMGIIRREGSDLKAITMKDTGKLDVKLVLNFHDSSKG